MNDKASRGWQRWFWAEGTATSKKWLIGLLLLALLGAAAPLLGRSFVPAAHWQKTALYITLGLLAAAAWWLRQLYRRGDWKPEGPWQDYGPIKRVLMLPLMVGFIGSVVWLNVAVSVPWAMTKVIGQAATQNATVEAERSTSRYSCRYQFKVQEIQFMFFEFCIDQANYEHWRGMPLPAVLDLNQSYFGKEVSSLSVAISEAMSVPHEHEHE